MIIYDPKRWVRQFFACRATVLPHIMGRVLFLTAVAAATYAVYNYWDLKIPVLDPLGHTTLGVALGLMIVFRNNSSYDRFWEGRKLWGAIVNSSRNLVRGGSSFTGAATELGRLVSAYVIALKLHLRGNKDTTEMQRFVSPELLSQASAAGNPPTVVAFHISRWIQQQREAGKLDSYMSCFLESSLNELVHAQGGCERILRTPIPFNYAVHIKQLLMIYLTTLPLVVVPKMGLAGVFAMPIIAFGLIGIEAAGVEIEDPFGEDPNDLPLDIFCETIARDASILTEVGKRG